MDRRPDAAADAPVAVTVGAAAEEVRRAVGPLAWCALEVLAAVPAVDGERWVVRSSVREVAAASRRGAEHRAARARGAPRGRPRHRGAGSRARGRFGGTAYRLTVDQSVLCRQTCEPLIAAARACRSALRPGQTGRRSRSAARPPPVGLRSSPCSTSRVVHRVADAVADKCPPAGGGGGRVDAAGDDSARVVGDGDGGVLRAVSDGGAGRGAGCVVGPPGGRARSVGAGRGRAVGGVAVGP